MGTSPSRSITAILISRFLIDLQEANADSQQQRSLSSVGTLDFNRFVGSISLSLPAPDMFAAAEVGTRSAASESEETIPNSTHQDDEPPEGAVSTSSLATAVLV